MSAYSMGMVYCDDLYRTWSYKRTGGEVKQPNHIIYHDTKRLALFNLDC